MAGRSLWLKQQVLPHEGALRACIARWRVPVGLEADDVVQEAYARIATLPAVDHIRNPKAYLIRTARMVILCHLRRSNAVAIDGVDRLDTLPVASDEPGQDVQLADRQNMRLLCAMIDELPKQSKAAMTLRMTDDLSHKEIGARLGMSPNAVQKSLARSLSLFSRRMDGMGIMVS